jgi:hypothetical protein
MWENARFGVYLTIDELERVADVLEDDEPDLSARFRERGELAQLALGLGAQTRRAA